MVTDTLCATWKLKKKKEPGGPTDLARNLLRFFSWTQARMGIFPTPSTVDFEWRLEKKSLRVAMQRKGLADTSSRLS